MANEKEKKPIYKICWFIVLSIILLFPILIFEIAFIIVVPTALIPESVLGLIVYYFIRKANRKKKRKEQIRKKESFFLKQGYRRVYDNLYINEENQKINILDKEYGFSQIIECELIENNKIVNSSYGNTMGKVKNNGGINRGIYTFSTQTTYCNEIYVNITVEDFNNPNIKLDVKDEGNLRIGGKKYKEALKNADNIVSLLKVIISKNNEKYIENGTITKIEHRYITEETPQNQIKKLSELYKDGILTEYEYSVKKQELLDKIK